MNTVLADPARMIAKGAPHVIHNDEELEAYTNALFQLTALESPSRSEVEAIELLTLFSRTLRRNALSDSCRGRGFRRALPPRATGPHTA